MNILRRLYNWVKSLFDKRYFRKIKFVARITEIPDGTGRDVYIVERGGMRLWLVFECPCNNNHRLTVNLSVEREPHWTTEINKHGLSVLPSIWLGDECRSHFWIRNSDITHV